MARPLDARARVRHLSDLTSEESWIEEEGVSVAYPGMLVVVYRDEEANNGVYRLKHRNFRLQENWVKVEGSGGTVNIISSDQSIEVTKSDGKIDLKVKPRWEGKTISSKDKTVKISKVETGLDMSIADSFASRDASIEIAPDPETGKIDLCLKRNVRESFGFINIVVKINSNYTIPPYDGELEKEHFIGFKYSIMANSESDVKATLYAYGGKLKTIDISGGTYLDVLLIDWKSVDGEWHPVFAIGGATLDSSRPDPSVPTITITIVNLEWNLVNPDKTNVSEPFEIPALDDAEMEIAQDVWNL